MAPVIKIHNDSDETIALIPFSRYDKDDLDKEFLVRERLAINIPKKGYKPVKCEDYQSKVSGAQIHMLFRAGEYPVSVKPGGNDKVFLYTGLGANSEWRLSLDKNRRVIGGPDNAVVPTSSGANAAESQLEILKKKVQDLEEQVKDLLQRVENLESPPRRR